MNNQSDVHSTRDSATIRSIKWLTELNLFETNDTDDQKIQLQRWSTRIYIITLSSALCILTIYASLQIIEQHIEIHNLTLNLYEKLQDKYLLECSCSNVTIPYKEFVHLETIQHQVCSSDFITQRWIDYLYNSILAHFYYPEDFRSTASQQFQLLAILCRLSTQAIEDGLRSFNNTKLITGQLLNKNLLDTQMRAHINTFKNNLANNFKHTLTSISKFLFSNTLLSGTQTYSTFVMLKLREVWYGDVRENSIFHLNMVGCYCSLDSTCQLDAGFFGDKLFSVDDNESVYAHLDIIDGWYIGCLPIYSLLFSTLKSFYNQTIVNSFSRFFINSSGNFTCLNANQSITFHPSNTTIQTIVEAMFIEKWIENIIYPSYFNICAPNSCYYTTKKSFNIFYIMKTVLGLCGGLTIALRFFIPMIINLVIERIRNRSNREKIWKRLRKLLRSILEINLFKSSIHVEPHDIQRQRWSTRFYILFFLLSLSVIALYQIVSVRTKQINSFNLTLNEILDLQQQTDLSSLQCPCSQLSTSLKHFVKFNPIYHEVCSHDTLLDKLILRFARHQIFTSSFNDFRQSGSAFKALKAFCELSKTTINNAFYQFNETQLVTKNLLTHEHFMSYINSITKYFITVTPNQFFDLLMLMRETTRANQFISLLPINYRLALRYNTSHMEATLMIIDNFIDINNQSCSFIIDRKCKQQCMISSFVLNSIPMPVPEFYVSYYPIESLLLSQIQVLYNPSIMHLAGETLNPDYNQNFTVLSQTSHFSINVTFDVLINKLFIEEWSPKFNYTAYFEQCQPHSCSYIVNRRSTIDSLISTVIGLFGGLSTLFRFVTPLIVAFVFARCCKREQQEGSSENLQRTGRFHIRVWIIMVWNKLCHILCTLNLFENVHKAHPSEEELYTQRRWTRVYLIILILILAIIMIFTAFTYKTKIVTEYKPTLDIYKNFKQSMDCPCTNLSIPYYIFIDLYPSFHEICSSTFIDQHSNWTTMLYSAFLYQSNVTTFQSMALPHFQALKVMCERVTQSVQNELSLFLNSTFISNRMIEFDVFQNEINATLENFISNSLSSNFLRSYQLIRGMYSGSNLISAFGTNWFPVIREIGHQKKIYMQSREYNFSSCNCATSPTCVQTMNLELKSKLLWSVPGMMSGCLPLESMLQSTLECIYDQECLNLISYTLNSSSYYLALNSNNTRFHPINTIKLDSIVNKLFIEEWFVNISFDSYFNACQPNSCSHTISKRFDIFYISNTLIIIYEGLSIILKLTIPLILKLGYKCLLKHRRRRQVMIA